MATTFAFDVYGTLIDPLGIATELQTYGGEKAQGAAELLRSKQLEYSFRRAVMGAYLPFTEVTGAALNYACDVAGLTLSEKARQSIMAQYRELPTFPEVQTALASLRDADADADARVFAFSNGMPADVAALLDHAGISEFFEGVVSVDDVQTFKPDPRVYAHFTTVTESKPENTWLVSSNAFDVIGAAACGWNTAWVRRSSKAPFDAWEHTPDRVLSSLDETVGLL